MKSLRIGRDCFINYVRSKVVKRLESYKLKKSGQDVPTKVLLPLSGGISSLALLHIVDQRLRRQIEKNQGRTTYELHVLVVESPHIPSGPDVGFFEAVREMYPSHLFDFISLTQITSFDSDALNVISKTGSEFAPEESSNSAMNPVDHLFKNISSPTARTDVLEVLLTRLIAAFAKRQQCHSIFWGHSDTRLAARTLASVAKGRGSAVPFQVLDGATPFGLTFNFPMRDLFKAELETYSRLDSTFPQHLVSQRMSPAKSVSNRDLSIDQLITNYITSQGEKYPSIMANVVRTAGKLHPPDFSGDQSARCRFCGLLLEDVPAADSASMLCYGCTRSNESIKKFPRG